MLQQAINPREEVEEAIRKYVIIDKRSGKVVVSSNSWRIAHELYDNGFNYDKTPYAFERVI